MNANLNTKIALHVPITKIKDAINSILKTSSYSLLQKDDLLNSYKFYIYTGDISGLITVKLYELEKYKTECNFQISNNEGIVASEDALSNLKEIFLITLDDLLNGKITIKKKWKNRTYRRYKTRAFVVFFIVLVVLGTILWEHYIV